MENKERYPTDWQLLTATSQILMPSRFRTFWGYVILGRKPSFTVEAWVHLKSEGVGELMLATHYK